MVFLMSILDEFCMQLVEIKNFNVLIDNELFFDQPVVANKKCMKNLLKCQEMIALQEQI